MKVKICGVRTVEEACQAVTAGADLLGFNFYPLSPRFITPAGCRHVIANLRRILGSQSEQVKIVGVFVNAPPDQIEAVLETCGLDLAQLSGDEPPELLQSLGERAFKALRPTSPDALEESVSRYPRRAQSPHWLVDAYRPGEYGGTGQPADWSLAARLAVHAPILLAGGLRPENVAAAVHQVRPWGVDVASGVESAPGVKDPEKVQSFIQAVRKAEKELA